MPDLRTFLCPCCLFPTLTENACYEICLICWWEDDGQNDEDADNVSGGPNGWYSLTMARKNFAHHGHMYDHGQGIAAVEQPSSARGALIEYLKSIHFNPNLTDVSHLHELLNAVHCQLDQLGE